MLIIISADHCMYRCLCIYIYIYTHIYIYISVYINIYTYIQAQSTVKLLHSKNRHAWLNWCARRRKIAATKCLGHGTLVALTLLGQHYEDIKCVIR